MRPAPIHISHTLVGLQGHAAKLSTISNLAVDEHAITGTHLQGEPRVVLVLRDPHEIGHTTLITASAAGETNHGTVATDNLACSEAGSRWQVGTEGPAHNFADPEILGTYANWTVAEAFLVQDNAWGTHPDNAVETHKAPLPQHRAA